MTQLADEAAVVDAPVQTDSATAPQNEPDTAEAMYADDVGEGETGEVVTDPNQETEGEPGEPAIPAPASWSGDAKEVFAQLPADVQKVITERETERERFVHTKAQEAAQVRQQAELAVVEQVAQHTRAAAQQLQHYAAMFEMQPPDPRLLQGSEQDRAIFYQQEAAFRMSAAQREQAQQQASQAQRQAEALEAQQEQHFKAQEDAILSEKIPEWRDPNARMKLLTDLHEVGRALGYDPQMLAEATSIDVLAMREAAEWKRKADRYDALNKNKMQPVRAAKMQSRVLQPGTQTLGQPAPKDVAAALYPNDVRR